MSEKKVRDPNFLNSEKVHLLRIISGKHASILEDKKTDRASRDKKEKAWQQITNEFNATSSMVISRSMTSLKKCYENGKKELRKSLAKEKKQVTLTVGGPLPKIKKHETDDILLSIMNKKTLIGLENQFDDDADETIEFYVEEEDRTDINNETFESENYTNRISPEVKWKNYTPAQIQEPISTALIPPKSPVACSSPSLQSFKVDLEVPPQTPNETKKVTPKSVTSRRRPTTVVKALTTSEISRKYDLLLDKRLQIVEEQLNHSKAENELIIRKRKLEIQLLKRANKENEVAK